MLWARMGAASLLLNNGLVLIAGGADESGPLATAELFDPAAQAGAGTFRTTAALASARQGATATLLGDGRALLAGGEGPAGSVAALELYEPSGNHGKGAFWSGPLLKTARSGHCAVALGDGRVLLAGGSTTARRWEMRSCSIRARWPPMARAACCSGRWRWALREPMRPARSCRMGGR